MGRRVRMDDIILQFSKLEPCLDNSGINFATNMPVKVKDFRFNDNNIYLSCSLTFESITYLKDHTGQFNERVFILIPNGVIPELDSSSIAGSSNAIINNLGSGTSQQEMGGGNLDPGVGNSSNNSLSGIEEGAAGFNGSVSSGVSSSSIGSSTSSIANTKSMLFQNRSPRILKLYLSIVFGVFISFIMITSINFILYLDKKETVYL